MGYVLILGANSDIGKALAEKCAFEGYSLYLADTNMEELEEIRQYLVDLCEADIQVLKFNATEFYMHRDFYKKLDPKPVVAIITTDYTGDQKRAQKDFLEAKKIIDTNYTGLVSILNIIAKDFEEREEGFIIGLDSIAGEENKQLLYTYSSAKQGYCAHLEGLKNRLSKSGVQVLIARPGFVHTKETKNIELPDQKVTIPGDAAEMIFNTWQKNKEVAPAKGICQKFMAMFDKKG